MGLTRRVLLTAGAGSMAASAGLAGVGQAAQTSQELGRLLHSRLREVVSENHYKSWFPSIEFEKYEDGVVSLSVSTKFVMRWLTDHDSETLLRASQMVFPEATAVRILSRLPPDWTPPEWMPAKT